MRCCVCVYIHIYSQQTKFDEIETKKNQVVCNSCMGGDWVSYIVYMYYNRSEISCRSLSFLNKSLR